MKNKKMLYILIPATLVVWGLIIMKILGTVNPVEIPVVQTSVLPASSGETEKDTFSIHPDYRDPFLRKHREPVTSVEKPVRPSIPSPPVVKVQTPWPVIQYNGTIKNQSSNKERVLLQVNGQDHMVQAGETIEGVLIYKVYKDSIEVHFLKEKKFIHK
jgi:type II secretory pathway component PulC